MHCCRQISCVQNRNLFLLGFFGCTVIYWGATEGDSLSYYQLNSHCRYLPEIKNSPYYLIWMFTSHLCLLCISTLNWILVLYKWNWPQSTRQPLQSCVHWNAACPHTLRTCHCEWKGSRENVLWATLLILVNWGQFRDVCFFWRLKQIFFFWRAHCIILFI